MVVNPFWFGVLITIFALFVFMFILAYVHSKKSESWEEYEPTEEEFRKAIKEISGKNVRVVKKDGFLIGEIIEDSEDES